MPANDKEEKKRPPLMVECRGPGPGAYMLPRLTGIKDHCKTKLIGPAYSIRPRLHDKDQNIGPGPKYLVRTALLRTGQEQSSRPIITGKGTVLSTLCTPGPDVYPIEKHAIPGLPEAPKYSISPKHRAGMRDSGVPGPGKYKLPTIIGRTVPDLENVPKYSMAGKLKGVGDDDHSPGPAKYAVDRQYVNKTKPPAYSIAKRTKFDLFYDGQKPGPGAHRPERCTNHSGYRRGPTTLLGVRHSQYITLCMTADDLMM